ncbi:MAG TPA: hypothetical protein VFT91_11835, partial [Dehalococcoidia bacterium]|nr:hypothetical protein [Dehalococcoidia bacterium]
AHACSPRAEQARTGAAAVDVEALAKAAAGAEVEEARSEQALRDLRARQEALAQALPLLSDVVQRRRELSERRRALSEQGAPERWTAEVARLEGELRAREQAMARADDVRQTALAAEAEAQAALRQAEEQLSARREARDEAVCSRCGQPVDPEHIRRELDDAERAVAAAQRQARAAGEARAVTETEAVAAAARREEAGHSLSNARQALAASQRLAQEEERASEQLQVALDAAAGAPADLLTAVVEPELVAAESALKDLTARDGELRRQVAAGETEAAEARQRARAAEKASQDAVSGRERLEAEGRREEDRAAALRRQAEVRLADVHADWRERALAGDEPFVERVTARAAELEGIEEHHAVLERAAAERGRQEARIAEVRRGLDSVAVEHRRPVEEAQTRRAGAQALLDESMSRRDEARTALLRLEEGQERREELNRRLREVQRQRALYARLADLLGRSGLQAFLLDAAVQGISHLANETLARISGGQLQLDVRRQASARGDEEIVIQATDLAFSEEPLDVQFVSGSQKFRTSVALAAAIGQYAGGGAGSVRSLIIDEGFGSLDSQGRQEMIDELHNLSQLVDRIIVVSHQEDFQDRTLFPTGYVLRKVGQRTEVERFV